MAMFSIGNKYYRTIPNTLQCKDCAYCWKEEGDAYPRCQWHGNNYCPDDIPPCEEEWTEEISAAEYYGYDEEEDDDGYRYDESESEIVRSTPVSLSEQLMNRTTYRYL